MPIEVACIACGATFSPATHAGLVRCAACTDRHSYLLPAQSRRAVVL